MLTPVADELMSIIRIRRAFCAWVLGDLKRLSQKNSRFLLLETVATKAGGLSRSGHTTISARERYMLCLQF